jgi:uncharacterized membrane protein YvbJ
MVPCPHCGEEIKSNARNCPHCGSDDETGWSEQTYLDGVDIPDKGSYEEIRRSEFDDDRGCGRTVSHRLIVVIVSLAVIVVLIAYLMIR